jgi:heme/copper-type cytochrome/quinol oxidase subunit 4
MTTAFESVSLWSQKLLFVLSIVWTILAAFVWTKKSTPKQAQ